MTKKFHEMQTKLEILAPPSSLTGNALLENPLLNKGTAFSEEERIELGLLGLLPPHIESLDDQVERAYEAFSAYPTDLWKNMFIYVTCRIRMKRCFTGYCMII